jgi:hypothetical protein
MSGEAEKTRAWEEVKRLRAMLEQTLNREQRRELNELVWAYRRALLSELNADPDALREKML